MSSFIGPDTPCKSIILLALYQLSFQFMDNDIMPCYYSLKLHLLCLFVNLLVDLISRIHLLSRFKYIMYLDLIHSETKVYNLFWFLMWNMADADGWQDCCELSYCRGCTKHQRSWCGCKWHGTYRMTMACKNKSNERHRPV